MEGGDEKEPSRDRGPDSLFTYTSYREGIVKLFGIFCGEVQRVVRV